MKLLNLDWWVESPIDFEHKKWIFLAYLRDQDNSFYDRKFNPYLMHSQRMVDDMKESQSIILNAKDLLTKEELVIKNNRIFWERKNPQTLKEMDVFLDILFYSIPLLENKLDFGWQMWKDNPTLLW
jgi:hypothetical protein